MVQYLVLPDLATAQAQSAAQAQALGCKGVTQFWWDVIPNAKTGEAALVLDDQGPYAAHGLQAAETAKLATLQPTDANWFPVALDLSAVAVADSPAPSLISRIAQSLLAFIPWRTP